MHMKTVLFSRRHQFGGMMVLTLMRMICHSGSARHYTINEEILSKHHGNSPELTLNGNGIESGMSNFLSPSVTKQLSSKCNPQIRDSFVISDLTSRRSNHRSTISGFVVLKLCSEYFSPGFLLFGQFKTMQTRGILRISKILRVNKCS